MQNTLIEKYNNIIMTYPSLKIPRAKLVERDDDIRNSPPPLARADRVMSPIISQDMDKEDIQDREEDNGITLIFNPPVRRRKFRKYRNLQEYHTEQHKHQPISHKKQYTM